MSDNLSDNIKEYLFLGIIGSGMFSTCYKVSHKTNKSMYVWKAIDYGWMNENDRQHLLSEINQLSGIRHPNIVQFFTPINHDITSNLYLRMQYYDAGDLSMLIKKHKKLNSFIDENFIWGVLYQISRGLHTFHSKLTKVTTLYCDVKAANIFMDGVLNVRLGGFGLSKRLMKNYDIESEMSHEAISYLSPEILSGSIPNKKSEIWSLGCLIYELSALMTPFNASNTHKLIESIQTGKRNKIPVHYSNDLQKIIDLMLTTDSEARPLAEAILYHPLVVSHITLQQLALAPHKKDVPACERCKDMEIKLEHLKQKEISLKSKENKLKEKEFYLIKREKQITLMEQLHKEKMRKLEVKQYKNDERTDLNDSSYSADPGDTSILATSSKMDLNHIAKPFFMRNDHNRRTVHFGMEDEKTNNMVTWLDNKRLQYNTKALGNVLKNQNRENHNKENRHRRGSMISLKPDTLETSKGILETHFF